LNRSSNYRIFENVSYEQAFKAFESEEFMFLEIKTSGVCL